MSGGRNILTGLRQEKKESASAATTERIFLTGTKYKKFIAIDSIHPLSQFIFPNREKDRSL